MAKGQFLGAISRFLCRAGEEIRFRPDATFAPPRTETEEDKKAVMPFLAYRLRIKSSLAKMCEQSLILSLLSSFVRRVFHTRVRSFGVLFFVCGFLQILSYFLGGYVPFLAGNEDNLIFGVSLIFLTLLCSVTRGDVRDALKKSFFFRKLLKGLFGVDSSAIPSGRIKDYSAYMVSFGALFALLSVVFTPAGVAGALVILFLILFICYLPEAGLVTAALGLLFLSKRALIFLLALTVASFLAKCAVGKRSLVFSFRDLPVVLGLFFLARPHGNATVFLLLSFYVLGLGLLRNLAWIRRFLTALTLGGVLCALLLAFRFLSEVFLPPSVLPDDLLPFRISEESVVLLAVLAPLSAGLFRSQKGSISRLLAFCSFALLATAVFTTGTFGSRIAFLASFFILFVFTYRLALLILVQIGLIGFALIQILPVAVRQYVLSFLGVGKEIAESVKGLLLTSVLPLVFLLGCFLYFVIRFRIQATRPEPFSQVLGGIGAMVSLCVVGFLPVLSDVRLLVVFSFLVLLPRVALHASSREEIRLPY